MSYCVNCGVELAASEKNCPLCGVEVINPACEWREPESRPYPRRVEKVVSTLNRKFAVRLVSLLMLIPLVIPFLTDILYNHQLTWSGYVIGADICLFLFAVFPFLYEVPHPYLYLAIDTVALSAYIALICYTTKGDWFLSLGLPLVLSVCVSVSLCIYIARRSRLADLYKISLILIVAALCCVALDYTISRYVHAEMPLLWSLFVLASCFIFAGFFYVLQKRDKLREEIIKRLYI